MTKIRLITGEPVVVPNSFLFKNPVKVLTNRRKRRISIIMGIAFPEKIECCLCRFTIELKEGIAFQKSKSSSIKYYSIGHPIAEVSF
jgi:hypothetical protein